MRKIFLSLLAVFMAVNIYAVTTLDITKSSNPASTSHVTQGQTITYFLTYNVTGDAVAVEIWDTINNHVEFLGALPVATPGPARSYRWVIGDITGSGTGNVTITARVTDYAGTLYNYGFINATGLSAVKSSADILYIDSPTDTVTETNTETVTETNTETITPTVTQTNTETVTPTITETDTETFTPTITQTITQTVTQTVTPTITQTITQTVTPTVTKTVTKTITKTVTPTRTQTYGYWTATTQKTATVSATYSPTRTVTKTNTPATATFTRTVYVYPSNTPANTRTFTPTRTASKVNTITKTNTPVFTLTVTKTTVIYPTNTPVTTLFTPSVTKTNSPAYTHTVTETWTESATITPTFTVTATLSPVPTSTWSAYPVMCDNRPGNYLGTVSLTSCADNLGSFDFPIHVSGTVDGLIPMATAIADLDTNTFMVIADTKGTTITNWSDIAGNTFIVNVNNFSDIAGNTFMVIADTKGTTVTNVGDFISNTYMANINIIATNGNALNTDSTGYLPSTIYALNPSADTVPLIVHEIGTVGYLFVDNTGSTVFANITNAVGVSITGTNALAVTITGTNAIPVTITGTNYIPVTITGNSIDSDGNTVAVGIMGWPGEWTNEMSGYGLNIKAQDGRPLPVSITGTNAIPVTITGTNYVPVSVSASITLPMISFWHNEQHSGDAFRAGKYFADTDSQVFNFVVPNGVTAHVRLLVNTGDGSLTLNAYSGGNCAGGTTLTAVNFYLPSANTTGCKLYLNAIADLTGSLTSVQADTTLVGVSTATGSASKIGSGATATDEDSYIFGAGSYQFIVNALSATVLSKILFEWYEE